MWSKLVPRAETSDVQPIQYRVVGGPSSSPAAQVTAPRNRAETAEPSKEVEKLQARIAELEQALAQQVAAARQAGIKEGEAAGVRQGEAAVKPMLDRMARAVQDLLAVRPRLQKEFETDAVQLSLAIARRILRREMNVDPSALCGLVQAAFERLGRSEIVRVIVHPEQVGPIREQLAQMTTRQVEVVADGSGEKGTLIFETTRGALDGSVDSQLKEIELGFADRLKWK